MTEAEWLACTDPKKMLKRLQGRASDSKLRLFACACCRRVLHLLNEGCGQAVGMVEEYVQTGKRGGLHAARRVAHEARGRLGVEVWKAPDRVAHCRAEVRHWASSTVWEAARQNPATAAEAHLAAARALGWWQKAEEEAGGVVRDPLLRAASSVTELQAQAALLRDLFGNPFRPVSLAPAWLTWHDGTVPKLAQTIYDDRDLPSGHLDRSRLAVLADALEDAGCDDTDILSHCRSDGPHVRGCWVVDLLLGKG
jgi:hypothetical protein